MTSTTQAVNKATDVIHNAGDEITVRGRRCKELRDVSIIVNNVEPYCALLQRFIERGVLEDVATVLTGDDQPDDVNDFIGDTLNPDGNTGDIFWGDEVREALEFQQLSALAEYFRDNPNTRRGILDLSTRNPETRDDIPCLDSVHFLIRNDTLQCRVHARSSEVTFAYPRDVLLFHACHKLLAHLLPGVSRGSLRYDIISAHVYLEGQ